jgi:hypothetical protein
VPENSRGNTAAADEVTTLETAGKPASVGDGRIESQQTQPPWIVRFGGLLGAVALAATRAPEQTMAALAAAL